MKNILFYIAMFFAVYFFSCNKIDLPDPVDGTPVFSAELNFTNGDIKKWEAGVDSFYMFTETETDAIGVASFIGRMEKETCQPNCTETLEIIIRSSGSPSGFPPPNPEIHFEQDEYPFYQINNSTTETVIDTSVLFYEINLWVDDVLTNVNPNATYEWYIDGITQNDITASATFDYIPQQATLKVTDTSNGDSCVVTQTQSLIQAPDDRCAVRIIPNYNPDFFLEFLQADPIQFHPPASYEWNNGLSDQIYNGQIEPLQEIEVTMVDEIGCSSKASFTWSGIIGLDTPAVCSAHFNYDIVEEVFVDSSVVTTPGDSLQLSAVTIIYTDEFGTEFRSDLIPQNSNSNFEIISEEEYEVNEKGEPTKKLELRFNCSLWDKEETELIIENGTATWGVAY